MKPTRKRSAPPDEASWKLYQVSNDEGEVRFFIIHDLDPATIGYYLDDGEEVETCCYLRDAISTQDIEPVIVNNWGRLRQ